ncbi:MAG: hypothetical protein EAX90_14195 [Candidatus Heimdallarchaeota archaeon]|nr:hypothetical protein [Candidatus Heimdallarchaeota archaeon]
MSEYIFKNYEEGFEEAQAKLGAEVGKDWPNFGYATAEALKNKYSQPEFDPELRHYVFKNDELVAFLQSEIIPEGEDGKKRANLDFPFIKEGHDEVRDLLVERAIKTLKDKGVELIVARALEDWIGTLDQAKKYGFKKGDTRFVRIEADINKMKLKETEVKFDDFHPENDKEEIIQIFKERFNMTDEQAQANFEGIVNPPEGFYAQPVLREENKIVSRGLLYIPKEPKFATFRLLTPEPLKNFDAYLSKITPIAKEKGSEIFQLFLGGPQLEHLEILKSKGFEVVQEVYNYYKEI